MLDYGRLGDRAALHLMKYTFLLLFVVSAFVELRAQTGGSLALPKPDKIATITFAPSKPNERYYTARTLLKILPLLVPGEDPTYGGDLPFQSGTFILKNGTVLKWHTAGKNTLMIGSGKKLRLFVLPAKYTATAQAKRTLVSQLENSLPPKRFDDWLRKIADPEMRIHWRAYNCEDQPESYPDYGNGSLMCVEATASGFDVFFSVTIQVEIFKSQATTTKPLIKSIEVGSEGEESVRLNKLREIRKKLDEVEGK